MRKSGVGPSMPINAHDANFVRGRSQPLEGVYRGARRSASVSNTDRYVELSGETRGFREGCLRWLRRLLFGAGNDRVVGSTSPTGLRMRIESRAGILRRQSELRRAGLPGGPMLANQIERVDRQARKSVRPSSSEAREGLDRKKGRLLDNPPVGDGSAGSATVAAWEESVVGGREVGVDQRVQLVAQAGLAPT
jgi:hypothetical protein